MEERNEIYVYDGSFLNGERENGGKLLQSLYHGIDGLNLIEDEEINISLNRMNFLNELSKERKLVIIPEVIREAEEQLRIVNGQVDFLRNEFSIKQYPKREEDQLEKEQQNETLGKIATYVNALYKFIKRYEPNNPKLKWDCINQRHYDYFLQKAIQRSKDIDVNSLESKVKSGIRKPVNIGAELGTDKKIVATSFTLAYSSPVIILTRDKGIEKLTLRISQFIEGKTTSPKNPVYIVNPDYEDIHSQGKQFFPWIRQDLHIAQTIYSSL